MWLKFFILFLAASVAFSGKGDKDKHTSEVCGLDMIPKVTEKQLQEDEPDEKNENQEIPDGSVLVDGDMLMTKEQAKSLKKDKRKKRTAIKHSPANHNYRWSTSEEIPYHLDATLTAGLKDVIGKAIALFQAYTCIKFEEVEADSNKFHIRYKKAAGSSSYVGKQDENINNQDYLQAHNGQRKKFQEINLGRFSMVSTVLHETMHAFGFVHEQERPDRDEYIQINEANIIIGKKKNFDKYTRELVDMFAEEYDFESIMHYGANYFAQTGPNGNKLVTMEAKAAYGGTARRIGSLGSLTDSDVRRLNKLFQCREPMHQQLLAAIQKKEEQLGEGALTGNTRGIEKQNGDITGGVCALYKKMKKENKTN